MTDQRYRFSFNARRRTIAIVAVAVAIVGYAGARFVISRQHDDQVRREMHAKAQILKDDIDRRFPAGTLRAQFMEFADKWSGWHADSFDDYFISVGQVPSPVWYCGPWDVVVVVSFAHDRLSATKIGSLGRNCP